MGNENQPSPLPDKIRQLIDVEAEARKKIVNEDVTRSLDNTSEDPHQPEAESPHLPGDF